MIIKNKKALFNYEIIQKFEAGIVLLGHEVKGIRNHGVNIESAYITYKMPFVQILNMHISDYSNRYNNFNVVNCTRPRILLLKKSEINKMKNAISILKHTIVPLSLYFNKKGFVKIECAIVKGKSLIDKRETIKKRDIERKINANYKNLKK